MMLSMLSAAQILFLLLSLIFIYYAGHKQWQLSLRVMLSLIIGAAYGFFLHIVTEVQVITVIRNILFLLGNGYLELLKMLVTPLILTSIIYAILNLNKKEGQFVKRLSFLTCFMLLGMTALSSLIGLLVGKFFHVGVGFTLPLDGGMPTKPYTGITDSILAMLPSNPIAAMAEQNTIAIVILALLLGLAAHYLEEHEHEKMLTFKNLIYSLFAIVKALARLILRLTPYGVFGLIALLVLEQGAILLSGLFNFILAMYTAMILVLLMHSIFLILSGYNPINYFKNAAMPLFVAFTTRSSFGTLPVTEETLKNKFKTNQVIASFVPSIGATIGMNACAGIFPAMLVMTALTILNQPLTLTCILTVMLVNAVASLGISGLPGTAYIAATVSLTSLNLPFSVVGLVQGIDPIIDMGRTAVNVNGVLTTALVADKYVK